jgi:TrmH family RNA methyltransferase
LGRLHGRRTREREGLVLVEGVRAVQEALTQGAEPRFVLLTREFRAAGWPGLELRLEGVSDVQEIREDEMYEVAGTETPQGVLLVADEPEIDRAAVWAPGASRVLILDGVQDPGNVGTLIRVAAAFGCSAVVALDGTADPWSAKALRAAAGTSFRLPVLRQRWDDVRVSLDLWGGGLLVADAGGRPVAGGRPPGAWALALGGEGDGCRPELTARADTVVSVPMPGGVESLNVAIAGGILLYELTRNEPEPEVRS